MTERNSNISKFSQLDTGRINPGRKMGPAAGSGAYSRKQKVGILEVEGTALSSNGGPASTTNRTSSASNYFPTRSKLGPKPLTG
tara:strand:- start:2952 stop:3203 length:252 start_codon:yes stop_codon:yes gene_type:complete